MADHTKIEWTEATWNPITGCSVCSPGCTNCYAMKLAGTRLQHHASRAGLTCESKAGPVWTGEVRFNEQWLDQPLRWRRPRMIFVCAHGDLFHESVPDEWINRVFAVMALCPQHTFQVLTKRSARMREYLTSGPIALLGGVNARAHRIWEQAFRENRTAGRSDDGFTRAIDAAGVTMENRAPWPLANVWLGVSVEDQARADERVPDLLETPAVVRWLSCEPLLSQLDLSEWMVCPNAREVLSMDPSTGQYECCRSCDFTGVFEAIDWVVAGGESGPGARPMHADWARSLRDQCATASVPFFFKQWGNHRPTSDCEHGEYMIPATKAEAGRHLDGQLHDAFPQVGSG